MAEFPAMTLWVEWAVIEGNHVAFYTWSNLPAPGADSGPFQFPNATALEYAGDGTFSYEEDFYNPADAQRVVGERHKAGANRRTQPDHSLTGIADWAPQPSASGATRRTSKTPKRLPAW